MRRRVMSNAFEHAHRLGRRRILSVCILYNIDNYYGSYYLNLYSSDKRIWSVVQINY